MVLVHGPLQSLQEMSASLGLHLSHTVLPHDVMNNALKDCDMHKLQLTQDGAEDIVINYLRQTLMKYRIGDARIILATFREGLILKKSSEFS